MKKDYNYIAKVESAIAKKYGKKAIQNPKSTWSKEKEKKHLSELKEFYSRAHSASVYNDTRHKSGGYAPCSVCGKDYYFITLSGEIAYLKWGVCGECFVDYIEGREEQWLQKTDQT